MTDAELNALEAAAKAATPGPWVRDGSLSIYGPHLQQSQHSNGRIFIANVSAGRNRDDPAFGDDGSSITGDGHADAAYIAAANPAAILDLIAELRQTRAEMDFILEQVDEIFDADDLLQAAKEAACQK